VSYAIPRRRPSTVRPISLTSAGGLLILAAVLAVVSGLATSAPIGAFGEATNNAYQQAGVADSAKLGEAVQADLLAGLAIDILFAAAFVALALYRFFVPRAGTGARIAGWVVPGLGLLWFGFMIFAPVQTTLSAAIVLVLLVAVVLLALPSSTRSRTDRPYALQS
jgi:hypothetical protein